MSNSMSGPDCCCEADDRNVYGWGEELYWDFMKLEKAYDGVNGEVRLQLLCLYDRGSMYWMRAVQNYYWNLRVYVREGNGRGDFFSVNVGLWKEK